MTEKTNWKEEIKKGVLVMFFTLLLGAVVILAVIGAGTLATQDRTHHNTLIDPSKRGGPQ